MDYIWITCMGIMIGSFLNVCIYRLPQHESIVFPGSHCVRCGHHLGPIELVPVMSYLALRGKCKHCGSSISIRYMLIELLTGILFLMVYKSYGFQVETLFYLNFVIFAIVLAMIDWDYMILPTAIIRIGLASAIVLGGVVCLLNGNTYMFLNRGLASILGYLIFMLIFYGAKWLLHKEGLGYGDVRLMMFLGFYVGLEGLVMLIIIACSIAALYGISLLIIKKKNEPFPLGPFLNIGAMMVILYGNNIWESYCKIVGL